MSFWRRLQIKINNKWRDTVFKKRLLNMLFWLSIGSIFIVSFLLDFFYEIVDDVTNYKCEGPIFLIVSIIPLTSIIMGVRYRKRGYSCKKNIIGGSIMFFILIMFSLIGFTTYYGVKDKYSTDYLYVDNLEEVIKFEIPDDGDVVTDKTFNYDFGDYTIISIATVNFNDDKEILEFNDSIKNSEIWVGNNSSYMKMLEPSHFVNDDKDNMYYMVYMRDVGLYNRAPNVTGNYHTYYLEYDMVESKMVVYEYVLEFSL